MRTGYLGLVLALVLTAAPVSAQQMDKRGVPYRQWDVDGGFGFVVGDRDEVAAADENYDEWGGSWIGDVAVGRYWDSHLKTSVGVNAGTSTSWYGYETVTVSPGQQGTAYLFGDTRKTEVTLAGTWQFLDNTFTHPYVSAGARIGFLDLQSQRSSYVQAQVNGVWRSFTIPVVERSWREVRTRPFVAIGSKAYFNERLFVRPELALMFNQSGLRQWGLRLGFGVDF